MRRRRPRPTTAACAARRGPLALLLAGLLLAPGACGGSGGDDPTGRDAGPTADTEPTSDTRPGADTAPGRDAGVDVGDREVVEPAPGDYGTPFTWSVDEAVEPPYVEVPRPDGDAAPVGAVEAPNGVVSGFVVGELVVSAEDDGLQTVLDLADGEVIATVDPADHGFDDLRPLHLVRASPAAADLARFEDDMRAASEEGETMGALVFSSEDAARTLALAAQAHGEGVEVGVSWVGVTDTIAEGSVLEAPTSPGGWGQDAFGWPHFAATSNLGIGVDLSWALLERSGAIDNTVGVAVLDGGICPTDNQDFPADVQGFDTTGNSIIPGIDLCNTVSFGSGWHGTHTFVAAMGVHDNQYGSTGPAAPVADPAIAVNVLYDPHTTAMGLFAASDAGADIASMSYRWTLPYGTGWTIRGYYNRVATAVTDGGMLLFGSAGNSDTSVDNRGCVGVRIAGECVGDFDELMFHVPCELDDVICVGGLQRNAATVHGSSNFGADDVDLSGPYVVPEGPDPDDTANRTETITGTSFATPFVAGVAALIWAADPTQTNDDVRTALFQSTQTVGFNGNPMRRGGVCASCAIQPLLPAYPPDVTIVSPQPGSLWDENEAIPFEVEVGDTEDDVLGNTLSIRWSGAAGAVSDTTASFEEVLCPGSYTVTVEVTDSDGQTTAADVSFDVASGALSVGIAGRRTRDVRVTDTATGETVDDITLVGSARRPSCDDPVGDDIPQNLLEWTNVTTGEDLGSGSSVTLTTSDLENPAGSGLRSVIVELSYTLDGETDTDRVTIQPCTSTVGLAPGEEAATGYETCASSAVAGDVIEQLERTFGTSDPDELDLIASGALDELVNAELADEIEDLGFCDPRECDPPMPMDRGALEDALFEQFGEAGTYHILDIYDALDAATFAGYEESLAAERRDATEDADWIEPDARVLFAGAVAVVEATVDYFAPESVGGRNGWANMTYADDPETLHEDVDVRAPARAALGGYLTAWSRTGEADSGLEAAGAVWSGAMEAIRQVDEVTDARR